MAIGLEPDHSGETMTGVHLQAGTVIVRHWRAADAGDVARHANDRRICQNLRDAFPHPYSTADAARFIAMATATSPQTYFAIEVEGHAAGGIGYTPHVDVERISAELGYWLGVAFWGRGIVTAAVRAVTAHAFAVDPMLQRLYAVPFATNPASARVLEKAGYRREGTLRQSAFKDGRVLDQWIYAIVRHEVERA
jgi:RimJ/RimL family protein N-acetyltransferase